MSANKLENCSAESLARRGFTGIRSVSWVLRYDNANNINKQFSNFIRYPLDSYPMNAPPFLPSSLSNIIPSTYISSYIVESNIIHHWEEKHFNHYLFFLLGLLPILALSHLTTRVSHFFTGFLCWNNFRVYL